MKDTKDDQQINRDPIFPMCAVRHPLSGPGATRSAANCEHKKLLLTFTVLLLHAWHVDFVRAVKQDSNK